MSPSRGNTGGGQPPPPTVISVWNYGAVLVPEWAAPAHGAVQEGCGAETTTAGRRGGKGGYILGVQRLWVPP